MTQHRSAEEEAYYQIKRSIILKRLLPGQQLTEEWISRNLKMSRTPVRAALQALVREGLITNMPNRGSFVSQPTEEEIRDVYRVRMQLEPFAARLAATKITIDHIEEMQQLSGKEKQAYELRDFEKFINVNNKMHEFPARITENTYLIRYIFELISWNNCYLILKDPFYTTPLNKVKSISEHKLIIQALEEQNPVKAETAVRKHLQSTLDMYITKISFSPFD